jgi:sulfite reductase beta subunit-like hemoprotein
MATDTAQLTDITILLPAGRLDLDLLRKVEELARVDDLELYLTIQQNLRLLKVPQNRKEAILTELREFGVSFKAPGIFPIPRICVGKPHCKLGLINTQSLSRKILDRSGDMKPIKPKLKIGISACSLSCSGSRTSDIGVVAKKSGYDVYAGGKGGPNPVAGTRVGQSLTEEEVLAAVDELVTFHDRNTKKAQRMHKLLKHPEFPFQ